MGHSIMANHTMSSTAGPWPQKKRELHNHHIDSTIWNEFAYRDGDIVIASYAKAGTTWVQQIVAQLLFSGAEDASVSSLSPWLDLRVSAEDKEAKLARLKAQSHRRFLKTHLPVDALACSPRAKYIYIARDGRDVVWSLHHHHLNATDAWYRVVNDTPGRVGPPIERPTPSVRAYFLQWLEEDGYPMWSWWDNVRGWWAIRNHPDLVVLHYASLKADMPGEIRRIATFLGIPIDESRWSAILEHCSFDYMKTHASKSVPDIFWEGGARTFINKGTNGRWRDVLTAADCRQYEERTRLELGAACAAWLATGK
jgi:aryl sulfotransferase